MSKQRQLTQQEKREQIKARLIIVPELSNRTIAKSLGVSHVTVGIIRRELENGGQINHMDTTNSDWLNHPFLINNPNILTNLDERGLRAIKATGVLDKMQEKNLTSPRYAQRLINKERKAVRKSAGVILTADDFKIFCADVRNGLPEIESESIDLILCDPPYNKKSISLYKSLSSISARVLRDGGSLLVMTGNSHLPEILGELTSCMKYHWTLCCLTEIGGSPNLQWKHVGTYWKPIFWLTKGKYEGDMIYDVVKAPPDRDGADKTYHEWGQSVTVFETLIERFTDPAQVILDPMCGSGTTAVAAVRKGRKCIATDIEKECVKITKKRVKEEFEREAE